MPAPDHYAVIGHPIAHSLSPRIHTLFSQQTGRPLRYEAIDVSPDALTTRVRDFFAAGGRGLNVTVPHKQSVMALLSRHSEAVRLAGAANTLWRDADGGLAGDNTDGVGLVRDLQDNLGLSVRGSRLLLLGAGGAARGVLAPLQALSPREVLIANRHEARALALAALPATAPVRAVALAALDRELEQPFDLILNATSASLSGELPALPATLMARHTVCYDLAYSLNETGFVRWARAAGAAAAHDGLGMLVEQAAEAFRIWHGVLPSTAPVIAALRPVGR